MVRQEKKFEIIREMSNAEYHDSIHWRDYISSTQLKWYLTSPKYFKYKYDRPHDKVVGTKSMHIGSLFHYAMECAKEDGKFDRTCAVFEPPINPKTDKPYGTDTLKYQSAFQEFVMDCCSKQIYNIATIEEKQLVDDMVDSLLHHCGDSSDIVRKFIKWGKETETSYFLTTEDGVKLKVRPDLLTSDKLIDWKTTSETTLNEDVIAKIIIAYRYDVSLAMYQWVLHQITGKWYTPYLVVVSNQAPYDSVVVDMSRWCYEYCENLDMMIPNCGAMEFRRLLGIHTECLKSNEWRGAESQIKSDIAMRIMRPSVPSWFARKYEEIEDNSEIE